MPEHSWKPGDRVRLASAPATVGIVRFADLLTNGRQAVEVEWVRSSRPAGLFFGDSLVAA